MPNLQFNVSRFTPLFEYLKKQKEIEKSRRLFEISITFLLISFFLFFAIRPTVLTISALVGEIKSKEILSTKMTAKINQVITAQDNFSAIQEKYFLVEDALPSTQNYADAMIQIDTLSSQNDIILDKLSFVQSDKQYFSTQISTSSTFASGLKLLESLFNNRRLLNISQVSFVQNKDTQPFQKINLNLPIDIYYSQIQNEKK